MPRACLCRRPRRAFSLLELIVVVVVLGLLAALAVPALRAVTERATNASRQAAIVAVFREAQALAAFRGDGRWILDDFVHAAADTVAADTVLADGPRWTVIVDDDPTDEQAGPMAEPLDELDELALEFSADGTAAGVAALGADGWLVHVAARVGGPPATGLTRDPADAHGHAALALLDADAPSDSDTGPAADAIVMTWDTTLPGCPDATISLPLAGTVDATVDWGDGATEPATVGPVHSYAQHGTYTVTVEGTFEKLSTYDGGWIVDDRYDMECLASVAAWTGDTGTVSTAYGLTGAANLTTVAAPPATVSDMRSMLARAGSFDGDVSGWDTSQVTDMTRLFQYATSFTGRGLAGWDTSAVTGFQGMFTHTALNADLSGWDTGQATDMSHMFQHAAAFDGDLTGWDTSRVTTMGNMFANATAFTGRGLSGWDTSQVTDMMNLFFDTAVAADLSGWDTGQVTSMRGLFKDTDTFDSDVSGWNVSNVTNMIDTFHDARAFNQDLSSWDVSSVTSYTGFDTGADSWTLPRPTFP